MEAATNSQLKHCWTDPIPSVLRELQSSWHSLRITQGHQNRGYLFMNTSRNCVSTWFYISLEMDVLLSQWFQLCHWTAGVKSMYAPSSAVSCPCVIKCHFLCNEGLVPSDGYQVLWCPLCPLHLFYVLCNVSCFREVFGSAGASYLNPGSKDSGCHILYN